MSAGPFVTAVRRCIELHGDSDFWRNFKKPYVPGSERDNELNDDFLVWLDCEKKPNAALWPSAKAYRAHHAVERTSRHDYTATCLRRAAGG